MKHLVGVGGAMRSAVRIVTVQTLGGQVVFRGRYLLRSDVQGRLRPVSQGAKLVCESGAQKTAAHTGGSIQMRDEWSDAPEVSA